MLKNWSQTESCSPNSVFHPKSVEEIQSFVKGKKKIKAVNALPHSPNAIWCSDGDMISLKNLSRIISVDNNNGIMVAQGGATIQSILDSCLENGRSFPSLPSIKTMTIAGAISTGAHGSGFAYGPISAKILAMKMVTVKGEKLSLSLTENKEIFRAALCSLGVLGIIYEVTLQTEESQAIDEEMVLMKDFDGDFHKLSKEYDFVKLYSYPHSGRVLKLGGKKSDIRQTRPEPRPWWKPLESLIFSLIFFFLSTTIANRLYVWWIALMYRANPFALELSSPIFEIRQHTTEWAVPLKNAQDLYQKMTKLFKENPQFPVHFLECRFTASDDVSYISPTSVETKEKDDYFCYIGIVSFCPFNVKLQHFEDLYSHVDKLCVKAGGRPHWAKNYGGLEFKEFTEIFAPNFAKFNEIRKQLDPEEVMMNKHLGPILNPKK